MKRIITKPSLLVMTLLLTVYLGLSVPMVYACGPGTKPCGDICIPSTETCNIRTKGGFWSDVAETSKIRTEGSLWFDRAGTCNSVTEEPSWLDELITSIAGYSYFEF